MEAEAGSRTLYAWYGRPEAVSDIVQAYHGGDGRPRDGGGLLVLRRAREMVNQINTASHSTSMSATSGIGVSDELSKYFASVVDKKEQEEQPIRFIKVTIDIRNGGYTACPPSHFLPCPKSLSSKTYLFQLTPRSRAPRSRPILHAFKTTISYRTTLPRTCSPSSTIHPPDGS